MSGNCGINTFQVILQGFESLAPNIAIGDSVTLPAPDGYFGFGTCIDGVGSNNCITLEPDALGCPYEPDECSEVSVITLLNSINNLY